MIARRAIVVALLACSAAAWAATPFAAAAAREIYAVFPLDRDRFLLAGGDPAAFALYGDAPGALVPVECRRNATFAMISGANERGHLGVGICHEEAARLRALAPKQRQGLDDMVATLRRGAPDWREEAARQAGFVYRSTTLPDGSEFHFFPVMLIGHGVLIAPTGVLLRGGRAIVVQAGTTHLCDSPAAGVKLCTHTYDGFADLARRLLAAFP